MVSLNAQVAAVYVQADKIHRLSHPGERHEWGGTGAFPVFVHGAGREDLIHARGISLAQNASAGLELL